MKRFMTLDVVISIVLLCFSAVFWYMSCSFPEEARLFPRIFLIVTMVLSALMLWNSLKEQKAKALDSAESCEEIGFVQRIMLPLQAYCMIVLYVLGIQWIGFFVATTVFMLVFMWYLNVRKPVTLAAVSVGMDIFLYLMFVVGLKLSLPAGILF